MTDLIARRQLNDFVRLQVLRLSALLLLLAHLADQPLLVLLHQLPGTRVQDPLRVRIIFQHFFLQTKFKDVLENRLRPQLVGDMISRIIFVQY